MTYRSLFFCRYLLTLREEINVNSVVDSLVQKGVISADAGTDIMRQGSTRAQIELCIQEVMKGGGPAYSSLCETLQEHGYNNIVDALKGDASVTSVVPGNVFYVIVKLMLDTAPLSLTFDFCE